MVETSNPSSFNRSFLKDREQSKAEETQKFGMDNVPGFDRPMSAGPNDPVVGFTESGQPVKKTFNGLTYTIYADTDQRTTRTKIKEDFIPAMQEWLSDPFLPSKEEVWEGAKAVGKEIAESAERAVSSTGTYGDVYNLAGTGAATSAAGEVPEGALRIFGGPYAKNFPVDKVDKAVSMREKGIDDSTIWEETGMQFNPETGKWQFEIDSKGMEFKAPLDDIRRSAKEALKNFGENAEVPLSGLVDFKELFENYPRLKETKVVLTNNPKFTSRGQFDSKKNELKIKAEYFENAKEEDIRETILHEIMHGVQAHEMTPSGNNMRYLIRFDPYLNKFVARDEVLKPYAEKLNSIDKQLDEIYYTPSNTTKFGKLTEEAFSRASELEGKREAVAKSASKIAYKRYLADAGETEARAAALRDFLTQLEKRETPISDTKSKALNEPLRKYKGAPELPLTPMSHPDEQGFAKGGQVMEDGFKDDGQEVDTRTGNEIPPGSLDQEVTDDVDAKLSEGEYVLPADVVRFIGLGQIEAMVQQAKQGLAQMESEGRIGGQAVDESGRPVDDEELTPEEMAMLEEALSAESSEEVGMAEGGVVWEEYKPKDTDNLEQTGYPKGGLVKKRPPNKRKKPVKKKKKYGLGTRP